MPYVVYVNVDLYEKILAQKRQKKKWVKWWQKRKKANKNENAPNRSKQTSNDVIEKNVHARYIYIYSDRLFLFVRFHFVFVAVVGAIVVASVSDLIFIYLLTLTHMFPGFLVISRFGIWFRLWHVFVVLFGFPNTYILSLNLLCMDCFFFRSSFYIFFWLFLWIMCLFFLFNFIFNLNYFALNFLFSQHASYKQTRSVANVIAEVGWDESGR